MHFISVVKLSRADLSIALLLLTFSAHAKPGIFDSPKDIEQLGLKSVPLMRSALLSNKEDILGGSRIVPQIYSNTIRRCIGENLSAARAQYQYWWGIPAKELTLLPLPPDVAEAGMYIDSTYATACLDEDGCSGVKHKITPVMLKEEIQISSELKYPDDGGDETVVEVVSHTHPTLEKSIMAGLKRDTRAFFFGPKNQNYRIYIGFNENNKESLLVFPDAGVLRMKTSQKNKSIKEVMRDSQFFHLLAHLIGEEEVYSLFEVNADKKETHIGEEGVYSLLEVNADKKETHIGEEGVYSLLEVNADKKETHIGEEEVYSSIEVNADKKETHSRSTSTRSKVSSRARKAVKKVKKVNEKAKEAGGKVRGWFNSRLNPTVRVRSAYQKLGELENTHEEDSLTGMEEMLRKYDLVDLASTSKKFIDQDETIKQASLEYKHFAPLSLSFYEQRIKLFGDTVRNSRVNNADILEWKIVDSMKAELMRSFLKYTHNSMRSIHELWHETYDVRSDHNSPEPEWKNAIPILQKHRQWSHDRSLLIVIKTSRKQLYISLRDFPNPVAVVLLPGRVIKLKNINGVETDHGGIETEGSLWSLVEEYFNDEIEGSTFDITASASDSLGSGYGRISNSTRLGFKPDSSRYKELSEITGAPLPQVGRLEKISEEDVKSGKEISSQIEALTRQEEDTRNEQLKNIENVDVDKVYETQLLNEYAQIYDDVIKSEVQSKQLEMLSRMCSLTRGSTLKPHESILLSTSLGENHTEDLCALAKQLVLPNTVNESNPYRERAITVRMGNLNITPPNAMSGEQPDLSEYATKVSEAIAIYEAAMLFGEMDISSENPQNNGAISGSDSASLSYRVSSTESNQRDDGTHSSVINVDSDSDSETPVPPPRRKKNKRKHEPIPQDDMSLAIDGLDKNVDHHVSNLKAEHNCALTHEEDNSSISSPIILVTSSPVLTTKAAYETEVSVGPNGKSAASDSGSSASTDNDRADADMSETTPGLTGTEMDVLTTTIVDSKVAAPPSFPPPPPPPPPPATPLSAMQRLANVQKELKVQFDQWEKEKTDETATSRLAKIFGEIWKQRNIDRNTVALYKQFLVHLLVQEKVLPASVISFSEVLKSMGEMTPDDIELVKASCLKLQPDKRSKVIKTVVDSWPSTLENLDQIRQFLTSQSEAVFYSGALQTAIEFAYWGKIREIADSLPEEERTEWAGELVVNLTKDVEAHNSARIDVLYSYYQLMADNVLEPDVMDNPICQLVAASLPVYGIIASALPSGSERAKSLSQKSTKALSQEEKETERLKQIRGGSHAIKFTSNLKKSVEEWRKDLGNKIGSIFSSMNTIDIIDQLKEKLSPIFSEFSEFYGKKTETVYFRSIYQELKTLANECYAVGSNEEAEEFAILATEASTILIEETNPSEEARLQERMEYFKFIAGLKPSCSSKLQTTYAGKLVLLSKHDKYSKLAVAIQSGDWSEFQKILDSDSKPKKVTRRRPNVVGGLLNRGTVGVQVSELQGMRARLKSRKDEQGDNKKTSVPAEMTPAENLNQYLIKHKEEGAKIPDDVKERLVEKVKTASPSEDVISELVKREVYLHKHRSLFDNELKREPNNALSIFDSEEKRKKVVEEYLAQGITMVAFSEQIKILMANEIQELRALKVVIAQQSELIKSLKLGGSEASPSSSYDNSSVRDNSDSDSASDTFFSADDEEEPSLAGALL